MANIRFTCEEKKHENCSQERTEATIRDENGDPQFQVLICKQCFGVIASTRLETPKADKKKRNTAKTEAAKVEETPIKTPVVETHDPEISATTSQQTEDPKAKTETQEELVVRLEGEGKPVVDIILELKSVFGLTNAKAAAFLKERKAAKEAKAESAPEIPVPLSEEHRKQRDESPIKPGNRIKDIGETEGTFPINFFELIPETKSYRFKLNTEEGVEFVFETTPNPEKYAKVSENPAVFNGKSLIFKYSQIDDAECPVNPVLAGVK